VVSLRLKWPFHAFYSGRPRVYATAQPGRAVRRRGYTCRPPWDQKSAGAQGKTCAHAHSSKRSVRDFVGGGKEMDMLASEETWHMNWVTVSLVDHSELRTVGYGSSVTGSNRPHLFVSCARHTCGSARAQSQTPLFLGNPHFAQALRRGFFSEAPREGMPWEGSF
jgi:hypothetical protein